MMEFDASQLSVLACDPTAHARILGAPGSGKSALVVESYARVSEMPGFSDAELLILAPTRLAAGALRERLETRLNRATGGTPVRTLASLAFAILGRTAASLGDEPPRLLTGTVQDEVIARVVATLGRETPLLSLAPEVLMSERFRSELREVWRVLDNFNLTPAAAQQRLRAAAEDNGSGPFTRAPESATADRWSDALALIERAQQLLDAERPHELSSSALLRRAVDALIESGVSDAAVPKLILIDDAQQLGEGELALVAACASLGSRIWVFGDPDVSAGAFQGEHAAVLTRLGDELERRGARIPAPEHAFVLSTVYRHGPEIRGLIAALSNRIGAAGAGVQRRAESHETALEPAPEPAPEPAQPSKAVRFVRASSPSEQLGALAYQLRARHLGLNGEANLPWGQMAVICRSRVEVSRISRLLAERQVPTGEMAGGLVLREHRIVRDLVALLRHALAIQQFTPADIIDLLSGPLGSLDRVAVRRLRGALLIEERRLARETLREPVRIDELLSEAVNFPGDLPLIDSAGGRALRRLGLIARAGQQIVDVDGSTRETLWAIWEATGLSERLQQQALGDLGAKSESAHRALDAVVALFFRLQRHEEQSSEQPIPDLLEEILTSTIPEDSLAGRSARDEVIVTTSQGAIGFEFSFVCVLGLQDGNWPNLRSQGSLLGALAFERWLLGGEARPSARAETLHDELRLFTLACSRARDEVLVLSIHDDEHHPGPFFVLGGSFEHDLPLPSERLSLRGAVAEMRRRLTENSDDEQARAALVELADQQVAGADPDAWYGVMPPSSTKPLVDLAGDPLASVSVSPSQLESVEACPLSWVIQRLGGGDHSFNSDLGTLLHHVLETAHSSNPEEIFATVRAEWPKLDFSAEWESERTLDLARVMVNGISEYLRQFDATGGKLLAQEAGFSVQIDQAVLRGNVDRLEKATSAAGSQTVTVLDLKTGKNAPSKTEVAQHAQLQAYQLGLTEGDLVAVAAAADDAATDVTAAQADDHAVAESEFVNGGARLLYVHPDATKGSSFLEFAQGPLSGEDRDVFVERLAAVAHIMAGATFTARVEHHCTDQFRSGNCELHIVPAVSHA